MGAREGPVWGRSETSVLRDSAWAVACDVPEPAGPLPASKRLYRERNLIERFFSKLKHCRVATRYDKLAANFLAMVQLPSIRLWLRAYESTT